MDHYIININNMPFYTSDFHEYEKFFKWEYVVQFPEKKWNWCDFHNHSFLKWECVLQFPEKNWNWGIFHWCKWFRWDYVVQFPDKGWGWNYFHNYPFFKWECVVQFPDKEWGWYIFHRMKWYKWKHFYYIFKNNKLDKEDILSNIEYIKDEVPIFIKNAYYYSNFNKKLTKDIIYSYIVKDINIKDEYYINVF